MYCRSPLKRLDYNWLSFFSSSWIRQCMLKCFYPVLKHPRGNCNICTTADAFFPRVNTLFLCWMWHWRPRGARTSLNTLALPWKQDLAKDVLATCWQMKPIFYFFFKWHQLHSICHTSVISIRSLIGCMNWIGFLHLPAKKKKKKTHCLAVWQLWRSSAVFDWNVSSFW